MHIAFLTPVFTGIAVADREAGSTVIKVKSMETMASLNGVIDDSEQVIDIEVNTPKGLVRRTLKVKSSVTATWFNRDPNRISVPDIIAGERVLVWAMGDSEDYYWEPLDLDSHLRLTERIVIAISNTNRSDRSNKELSAKNCYFIELDTINKYFKITTNKNDGEPFAYEIELNTGKGFLKSSDDVGNLMLMDSKNTIIQFLNKDKTEYRLDKQDIYEHCLGNHTRIVGGNLTERVAGTRTREVTKEETINSAKLTHTTKQVNFDSPSNNFNGVVSATNILIGASFGAPGSTGGGGGASAVIIGKVSLDGDLIGTGAVESSTMSANTANFKDGHGPH